MHMSTRIPRIQSGFDDYIANVFNHINATEPGGTAKRGETLGMTAVEIAEAGDFFSKWHSVDPAAPGVYDLHRNPDTRTRTTRKNVVKLMKDFNVFFRPILNRINVSPAITSQDYVVLRIAEPNPHRRRPTTAIPEKCIAGVTALGGGELRFVCRYITDSKRASKPPLADAVEVAYAVCEGNFLTDGDLSGKVKRMITGPEDGTTIAIFTKARFILHLDPRSACKELQFYARWINTKHADLAGPWTGPFIAVIL
jgi:hypothetical protein